MVSKIIFCYQNLGKVFTFNKKKAYQEKFTHTCICRSLNKFLKLRKWMSPNLNMKYFWDFFPRFFAQTFCDFFPRKLPLKNCWESFYCWKILRLFSKDLFVKKIIFVIFDDILSLAQNLWKFLTIGNIRLRTFPGGKKGIYIFYK